MLVHLFLLGTLAFVTANDICGGRLDMKGGHITSPRYPNLYRDHTVCEWNIIASEGETISLAFRDFHVEDCSRKICGCDSVEISEPLYGSYGKFCGSMIPPAITSKSNHLNIIFKTDQSQGYKGFRAFYEVNSIADEVPKGRLEKDKNVQWLLNQISERRSLELPRTTLALFLAEPELFEPRNRTLTELKDSLTIRILAQLSRNETIRSHELALYVQALMVTCQNPRDFYGHDLLSELRSRADAAADYVNPFEILALCNAGAEVTAKDVDKVSTAFDSQHRPFWTDVQAIATMAMKCLSSRLEVDERVVKDMQDELKKRQFRNGTVENLVTTALVVQALGHKNGSVEFFDLPSALDVLTRAQDGDGSWGKSIRNSFYLLPAISQKSFLDINDRHCPKRTETEEETLSRLQETTGDTFVVQYSVWIGEEVDLGRTWRIRVQSNKTTTFYDVIEMVSKLDNRHNVTYQVVDRKPYVRSLLGKEDDPESGIFWFTYVRSTSSKAAPTLIESSPAHVNVLPNQELILWYKSNDWNRNITQAA